MKFPSLGIIIVLCLQLGFTAYNAVDRPIESLIAVNAISNEVNEIARLPTEIDDIDQPHNKINEQVKDPVIQISFESSKKSRRRTSSFSSIRFPQYEILNKPFRSTVITYPSVIRTVEEKSGGAYPTGPIAERKRTRSFASRSIAVVKKPYEWIKILGTKFN